MSGLAFAWPPSSGELVMMLSLGSVFLGRCIIKSSFCHGSPETKVLLDWR